MSRDVLKVVVMGDNGVGKSSIIHRLMHGVFLTHYDPTIEGSLGVPL
jgi:GTPase SAR1 family protein